MQKILFFWCFFPLSLFAQTTDLQLFLDSLNQKVALSILVQNHQGDTLLAQNITDTIPSASVIKIPILLELLNQIQQKKLKFSEKYILKSSDKVAGAGDLQKVKNDKKLTINKLAIEMIRTSDNTATNILIQRLGMENINRFLTENNCFKTSLQRKMIDFEAIKLGKQNYANVLEINYLLFKILQEKILTPQLCQKAIKILKRCEDRTTIPRLLPKNIKIAHKTGTLDYVRADAGIVYTTKPLIMSIFVEKFASLEQAELIIAQLAQHIVNQFGGVKER